MEEEDLKDLAAQKEYIDEWKDRLRKAQDIAPEIIKYEEHIDWELNFFRNVPMGLNGIDTEEWKRKFHSDRGYLVKAFPMIPNYGREAAQSALSVVTSGTTQVVMTITDSANWGAADTKNQCEEHLVNYRQLQSAQDKPKDVRSLIEKLSDKSLLQRFDNARAAYYAVKVGSDELDVVASAMRNLLYGLNGVLLKRANVQKSWLQMAEKISKGGKGSIEEIELIKQENVYKKLTNQLSPIAKDRVEIAKADIDVLWTEVIDHMFVVLGLIKF